MATKVNRWKASEDEKLFDSEAAADRHDTIIRILRGIPQSVLLAFPQISSPSAYRFLDELLARGLVVSNLKAPPPNA